MNEVIEYAKTLRMAYIYKNWDSELKKATAEKKTPAQFVTDLFAEEVRQRREHTIQKYISQAKFPFKRYLEDFDHTLYKQEISEEMTALETLEFIENGENVILIGTPGCGKTHFAIGLGHHACLSGKRVLFATVPDLLVEIREAMSKNGMTAYRRKFLTYDLVILDELGYVSFDKTGCELLFNLLSSRNENGSIMLTTNLAFDRWEEIFHDPMITGAITDRLAYKAHILDLSLKTSHRYLETVNWKEDKKMT